MRRRIPGFWLAILLAWFLILWLGGCTTQGVYTGDFDRSERVCAQVIWTSPKKIQRDTEYGVEGYARYHLTDPNQLCYIYAPMPTHVTGKRMGILGHEFLHCIIGRYHD